MNFARFIQTGIKDDQNVKLAHLATSSHRYELLLNRQTGWIRLHNVIDGMAIVDMCWLPAELRPHQNSDPTFVVFRNIGAIGTANGGLIILDFTGALKILERAGIISHSQSLMSTNF
jgi:hypothetical protein